MKRVKHLWGEEFWIINSKKYCGKRLSLKKGFYSSLHYHKQKDETFYVLEGRVMMEVGKKRWIMRPGSIQRIRPNCLHRFTTLTDAEIIEFSTHHFESDTFRKELSGKK